MKIRYFLVALCLAGGIPSHALAQLTVESDGSMSGLITGQNYFLDPRPALPGGTIHPSNHGEDGTAAGFLLTGPPNSSWIITFNLPPYLADSADGYQAACTYDDYCAWSDRIPGFWNPTIPETLVTNAQGNAIISLGLRLTAPPKPSPCSQEGYYGRVVCIAGCVDGNCLHTAESEFRIVYPLPSPPSRPDGWMTNLLRGGRYVLTTTGVGPNYSPGQTGVTVLIGGGAMCGAQIVVSFNLPDSLRSADGLHAIPCFFSGQSAAEYPTGASWDPNLPHTLSVSDSGVYAFTLGFGVAVPVDAQAGVYTAGGTATVAYAGNAKRHPADAPTADFTFTVSVVNDVPSRVYLLSEVWPNPSSGTADITVVIPFGPSGEVESARVKAIVCNVLGEKVATFADGVIESGNHLFQFNAVGLPQGVYFCRVTINGSTAVRKFVIYM
jgi:hypothetical protein